MRDWTKVGERGLLCTVAMLVLANGVMLQRTEHTGKRVAAIEAEVRQANAIRTGEEHRELRGFALPTVVPTTVRFERTPAGTLVLFYSDGCPYCAATMPQWAAISERSRTLGVATVSVDVAAGRTGSAIANLAANAMADRAETRLVYPDTAHIAEYRVSSVPVLVRLDGAGIVRDVWYGKIGKDRLPDVLRALEGDQR